MINKSEYRWYPIMKQKPALVESEIGKRIKSLRHDKRITLETLATHTGFTKSYLSKVENSEKAPPVTTLIKIGRYFGVTISFLLGEDKQAVPISLTSKEERSLVRTDVPDAGYSYEPIALHFKNKAMQPFFMTFRLEQKKQSVFQHEGEEFLFVLEGKMKLTYGGARYFLEEGDSIYFDSSTPHRVSPSGSGDVKFITVFTSPATPHFNANEGNNGLLLSKDL
jgi:transcriptional regulator with XRE-family HTH domain